MTLREFVIKEGCGEKCCANDFENEDFDDDVLTESRVLSIAMRLLFVWGWLPETIFQLASNHSFKAAVDDLNEKINDCDTIKFRNTGRLTYIIVKIKDADIGEDGDLKDEFYSKFNSECRKVAAAAKKVNKFREHPSQLNSKVEFKGTAIGKNDKKKIKGLIKTILDIKVS